MSSQIFYERVFIKLPDDCYIPLFLNGSSNTYESSGWNARRERDWWEFRPESAKKAGQYILTRQQVVELSQEARTWPYSGMCIGHRGAMLYTEEQAERYILNGLDRALTPEEIFAGFNHLRAYLHPEAGGGRLCERNFGLIDTTEKLLDLYRTQPNDRIRLCLGTRSKFNWPPPGLVVKGFLLKKHGAW